MTRPLATDGADRAEAAAARLRVLLVEDHDADALLITQLLQEAGGFEVVRVARLGEALARLAREPFQLVLLDLVLPDGQGLPVVAQVVQAAGEAAVVVASGLDDPDLTLARLALAQGAEDYLPKDPPDGDRLVRTLITAHERARLRRLVREHQRRLDEAQRIGRFGTWRWPGRGWAVHLSRPLAELLGLGAAVRIPLWRLWRRVHPQDRPQLQAALRRLLQAAPGERLRCQLRDLAGRPLEVELVADEEGLAGLCRDVSERCLAERAREAFFASAGHELRTPLTVLQTALALLEALHGESLPSGARELLQRARRSAGRLADLVEALLRCRGGDGDGGHHDLVRWLRRWTAGPAEAHGVVLELAPESPPTASPVGFDPARLEPLLWELARQVAADAGVDRIRLALAHDDGEVRLEVRAPGMAEPPAWVAVDEAVLARAARAGRALGLAAARELLRHLGGALAVAEQAGCWVAVRLSLPLAREPSAPRPVEEVA